MLSSQEELVLSPHMDLYNKLIPDDHLLRQLNELVDFSFVYEELSERSKETVVCGDILFSKMSSDGK